MALSRLFANFVDPQSGAEHLKLAHGTRVIFICKKIPCVIVHLHAGTQEKGAIIHFLLLWSTDISALANSLRNLPRCMLPSSYFLQQPELIPRPPCLL